jgi:hypothetical protein
MKEINIKIRISDSGEDIGILMVKDNFGESVEDLLLIIGALEKLKFEQLEKIKLKRRERKL